MHYHRIPHSALEISQLGLGTMTFGEQNSEADAHAQLDYAVSQGINLIDVAEMYPVPPRPETQGLTETYVGNWLAKRGNREKLVIASKVSGPARNNDAGIRPNQILDRKNIRAALDASLKRLQTDYLDLYQVHWPQRPTNCFGKLGYSWNESAPAVTLLETLEALTERPAPAPVPPPALQTAGVRIAVAQDKAFCFAYAETLDCLRTAGAELDRKSVV